MIVGVGVVLERTVAERKSSSESREKIVEMSDFTLMTSAQAVETSVTNNSLESNMFIVKTSPKDDIDYCKMLS